MADKFIVGKKDIGVEIEALKKALIKKGTLTNADIDAEKPKKNGN